MIKVFLLRLVRNSSYEYKYSSNMWIYTLPKVHK